MNALVKEDFDAMFPDIRESGDTRLRQCQLVMLRMLKIFDYLCTKHNIPYFLVGGSLLGSIRHKGFIPWDDDMDIGMTRKNYNRFVSVAAAELPGDVFFQNQHTDPFFPMYGSVEAKLRDKYSSHERSEKFLNRYKFHDGLEIDIFVYDRAFLPSNKAIFKTNYYLRKFLRRFRSRNLRATVLQMIEKLVPLPLVYASGFINRKEMVAYGANYIKSSELKTLVQVPFEDMMTYAPAGWDACLQRQYGNYMTPPPPEKQFGHHGLADPFTPCNHKEILYWKDRKVLQSS